MAWPCMRGSGTTQGRRAAELHRIGLWGESTMSCVCDLMHALITQYQPVPPPSARRPTSAASAVPQVFSAALSKVVRRGPLDEDDELASAKGALERLEERWGGAAAAVGQLGKARRGERMMWGIAESSTRRGESRRRSQARVAEHRRVGSEPGQRGEKVWSVARATGGDGRGAGMFRACASKLCSVCSLPRLRVRTSS
jgi:hypothetical protein